METIALTIIEQKTFTKISSKIYSLLTTLSEIDEVKLELEKLDIEAPLKVMNAFIIDIYNPKEDRLKDAVQYMINGSNEKYLQKLNREGHLYILNRFVGTKKIKVSNYDQMEGNSLIAALNNVKEIMDTLQIELQALKEAIDYHESKYFYYWRGNPSIPVFLEQLKIHKNIFNGRTNLLMQIAMLYA